MEELQDIFNDNKKFVKLMQPYRAAIRIIQTKIEALDDEMRCSFEHNPIHDIKSRIKGSESIINKLKRKEFPVSMEGFCQLKDVAGLRVICHYINDINYVAQLLILHDDICLVKQHNYIMYPKANGYRSLHLIIEVPIYQKTGVIKVPVEIQIRTIAMDCWASLEHELNYKAEHTISKDTYNRLKKCAENMAKTDHEMQNIYQELNSEWSKI